MEEEHIDVVSVDNFSPPPDGIVWFDNKRGYVKFKTHAEMLRYGLTCYKVPETWIDKILEEFPDRKWDSMDIYDIQFEYRETNKTLQDVVKHFRGWWA